MRTLTVILSALILSSLGCYSPEVVGLIEPDEACEFSTGGTTTDQGSLDVGPIESLTHSYEAVLLIKGRAGDEATLATVAFSDVATDDPLPNVTYGGQEVVFPSVEGERESAVSGTIGEDGLGAIPFTLVTAEEAAPLQALTSTDDELELRVEIRATVGGVDTEYPYFATLRVCQQCLVGVGAEVQDDALVCSDGSDPRVSTDAPCREGQDGVWSTCN